MGHPAYVFAGRANRDGSGALPEVGTDEGLPRNSLNAAREMANQSQFVTNVLISLLREWKVQQIKERKELEPKTLPNDYL
jgi:hypothetical protein